MPEHSISSMGTYRTCPKKWKYRYVDKLDDDNFSGDAQQLGTLIHHGLATILEYGLLVQDSEDDYFHLEVAVSDYAKTEGIPSAIVEQALNALMYYVPQIGLNSKFAALTDMGGKPLVEVEFNGVDYKGVKFKGFIDAIVEHADGRIILLDWKTRQRHYPTESIKLDTQLYLYHYAAEQLFGIKIDEVMQVQLVVPPPGKLSLNKDGSISKSNKPTTRELFMETVEGWTEEDKDAALFAFSGKIVEPVEFLRFTRIDLSKAPQMMEIIYAQAKQIEQDAAYLPVLNAYVCKGCSYLSVCAAALNAGTI